MRLLSSIPTPRRVNPSVRRGFSLTEIMFAVVILGIGFILVAGVFPVAILQTRSSVEETGAQALARSVGEQLTIAARQESREPAARWMFPPTGDASLAAALLPRASARPRVFSVLNPQANDAGDILATLGVAELTHPWLKTRSLLLGSSDRRLGGVLLYRRGGTFGVPATAAPVAEVYIVAVTPRNASTFTNVDRDALRATPAAETVNLTARPVALVMTADGTGPRVDNTVAFTDGFTAAAAEGAFLIISDDGLQNSATPVNVGRFNGKIYRLGRRGTPADDAAMGGQAWTLAPGYEFRASPDPDGGGPETDVLGLGEVGGGNPKAYGFLVGRGLTEPTNTSLGYSGPAMDVAVFSTFVPLP